MVRPVSDAALATFTLEHADCVNLAQSRLFANTRIDQIEDVLSECNVIALCAGDPLISTGEISEALYLVLEGRINVYHGLGSAQSLQILEVGDYFGEVSLIDRQSVHATAFADTDSRLLAIGRETFWKLIRTSHAVACNLLATIGQRLHTHAASRSERLETGIAPNCLQLSSRG